MGTYLSEVKRVFPKETAADILTVIFYELGDVCRGISYMKNPEVRVGKQACQHYIEVGISDALAQIHALCEYYGLDFDCLHKQALPRLQERMSQIKRGREAEKSECRISREGD